MDRARERPWRTDEGKKEERKEGRKDGHRRPFCSPRTRATRVHGRSSGDRRRGGRGEIEHEERGGIWRTTLQREGLALLPTQQANAEANAADGIRLRTEGRWKSEREAEAAATAIPNRIRPTSLPSFSLTNNKDDASSSRRLRLDRACRKEKRGKKKRRQFETMMGRTNERLAGCSTCPLSALSLSHSVSDGLSKSREEREEKQLYSQSLSLLPSSSPFLVRHRLEKSLLRLHTNEHHMAEDEGRR